MRRDYIITYENQLRLKNRSPRTIETYKSIISKFITRFGKHPKQIVENDIIDFILQHENSSTKIQVIGALKTFYKDVVRQPFKLKNIPYPKREKRLPTVLPMDFIWNKINAIHNKKHRAILAIGASTGMRVSEVCGIKLCDLDSKSPETTIKIVQGKGAKDRLVPMHPRLLGIIREYYRVYHPTEFLFNGQFSNQYSTESCEAIYHKYIDKNTSYHCLRHSLGTHLTNRGVNIRFIQELLGHKNSTTTEVYTHISKSELYKVMLDN